MRPILLLRRRFCDAWIASFATSLARRIHHGSVARKVAIREQFDSASFAGGITLR
jgi:hypothetical protein